jgi:hypothetical protein
MWGLLPAGSRLSRGLLRGLVWGFTNPVLYLPVVLALGQQDGVVGLAPAPLPPLYHLRRLIWPRHRGCHKTTSSQLGNNTLLALLSLSCRGRFQKARTEWQRSAVFLSAKWPDPAVGPKRAEGSGSCSGRERPNPTKKKAVRKAEIRGKPQP